MNMRAVLDDHGGDGQKLSWSQSVTPLTQDEIDSASREDTRIRRDWHRHAKEKNVDDRLSWLC
jgi:hypothetical protein